MSESFLNGRITLHCGDCLDVLATLPENSIDSCVTDPPYGLQFMGREWDKLWRNETEADAAYVDRTKGELTSRARKLPDYKATNPQQMQEWHTAWARQVYRVLKPGAHLLAFGGTRTYHRMACAIEDAGFEIRDCIQWLYGSGFPKSHDVSKGIDRAAGIERERINGGIGSKTGDTYSAYGGYVAGEALSDEPATDAARQWQGWGTALKPSHEDLIIARKPYEICGLCDSLVRKIMEALCQLPSIANAAAKNSPLSLSVFGTDAGRVSAQWNAVLKCNIPADLFGLMDMWPSELEIPLSLSIALSWLAILVEASAAASMFTTETETSLTTDLKTLNCLLSSNTADYIIEAATNRLGTKQNVSIAEDIFSAVKIKLRITNTLSVPENASALAVTACPAEAANYAPNCEPIVLARKPLSERTVAANVLRWGVGALNIDACRIEGEKPLRETTNGAEGMFGLGSRLAIGTTVQGRWPANIIHDGSEEVVGAFPDSKSCNSPSSADCVGTILRGSRTQGAIYPGEDGSAARFFYTAKPNSADASAGGTYGHKRERPAQRIYYTSKAGSDDRLGSKHPTVKPLDLMRYLVRLVTPKGGTVLDPFAGTGTTGEAAWREGMNAVLIERETEYQADIRRRMELCLSGPDERQRESIKAKLKDKPLDHGPLFGAIA